MVWINLIIHEKSLLFPHIWGLVGLRHVSHIQTRQPWGPWWHPSIIIIAYCAIIVFSITTSTKYRGANLHSPTGESHIGGKVFNSFMSSPRPWWGDVLYWLGIGVILVHTFCCYESIDLSMWNIHVHVCDSKWLYAAHSVEVRSANWLLGSHQVRPKVVTKWLSSSPQVIQIFLVTP